VRFYSHLTRCHAAMTVLLRASFWAGMLALLNCADANEMPQAANGGPTMEARYCKDFSLSCQLRRDVPAGELLALPGVCTLLLRQAGDNTALQTWDRRQNYQRYAFPDGRCPVLEAVLTVHSDNRPEWRELRVGFPLRCLQRQDQTEITLVLDFSGAALRLYADGRLMDENFPYGYPSWPDAAAMRVAAGVSAPTLSCPGRRPPTTVPRTGLRAQYFTPEGHNSWVGDVVTFFHDGVFHLYYLLDRRHHSSKFGCGGHYFAHLSSSDLRHWTEHPTAISIDEQWETIGTGTPFLWDGRICFSYGMHSTRMDTSARDSLRVQHEYLSAHGHSGVFTRDKLPGVPAGTLCAFSDDGINFRKSGEVIHPCENPSIYALPDGQLLLFAGYGLEGTWLSDRIGAWRCVNPSFPPRGGTAPMRNSSECQCYFAWRGRHYVLGGFSGFFVSDDGPFGPYRDLAAEGHDLYDGLGVPMVAAFTGDRRILAGWLGGNGWGGHLVLRELLQLPDGNLGMKWPPEVTPDTAPPEVIAENIVIGPEKPRFSHDLPKQSLLLSLRITPSATAPGRFALRVHGDGGQCCELQLDFARGRAQWHDQCPDDALAEVLPSARELCAQNPEVKSFSKLPNTHMRGRNFCRENALAPAAPCDLRLLVIGDDKLGGCILDAEFAGRQTMVTSRLGLWPRRVELLAESATAVADFSIAALRAD
jgi:hypothetical protein